MCRKSDTRLNKQNRLRKTDWALKEMNSEKLRQENAQQEALIEEARAEFLRISEVCFEREPKVLAIFEEHLKVWNHPDKRQNSVPYMVQRFICSLGKEDFSCKRVILAWIGEVVEATRKVYPGMNAYAYAKDFLKATTR